MGRHNWTEGTIQKAVRLGVEIPSYRRAADAFQSLTHVALSKSSMQQLVQEKGTILVEEQEQEAERWGTWPNEDLEAEMMEGPAPDSEVMAVSMDGVMVNTREEGWKEVKIAAISAVEMTPNEAQEEATVKLHKHSYRAGLWEAKTFAKHQWAEACRRAVQRARQIVCVNDAAAWIWVIVRTFYAPCVEVIDWWHAVQHLWQVGHALLGVGNPEVQEWVETLKTLLWQGKLGELLGQVRRLWPRGEAPPEGLRQAIGYLFRNRSRMRYASFREQGYPTGSGTVESGCKTVVQQRMCQAGMRWANRGLQAVLALRCALLSDRWADLWAPGAGVLNPP